MSGNDDATTTDGFLGGRLTIAQPVAGYRAAADPVLDDVSGAPPSILVDVASAAPVTLPVAAVHALVGADSWLPPWAEPGLASDLLAVAQARCSDIVDIRVEPAETPGQSDQWSGALQVIILYRVDGGADFAGQKHALANAFAALSSHPRLISTAPAIEMVPKPVGAS